LKDEGWKTLKARTMATGDYQEMDREASREPLESVAKPVAQDSETLRAGIARELKMVERMRSTARPLALVVFIVLGLLVASQFYTWMRLAELTTLSQQRDERAALTQVTLQENIERQRAALEQAVQQMTSVGQASTRPNSPGRENGARGAASAAGHEPLKPAKASNEPRPERQAVPSAGTGRPVAEQDPPPAAAQQASTGKISAMAQGASAAYRDPPAIRRDLSANNQGASLPPTSQAPSPRQGLGAIQSEQHEGAETSGVKVSQPDAVVARDHNEIEKLRKLGKRDYVEFTLVRSKTRQEVAPDISVQLKKVDSKRSRCSLNIYAEGYEFPADLDINQPVVFPIQAMWESVQLVIIKMGKDDVAGYLSARKGVLVAGK
jgi:hypothetical protein